jgi:hypothetical protein
MDKIIYILFVVVFSFIIYLGYKLIEWVNVFYDKVKKPECHCCGYETELEMVCEKCDDFYCENCSAPFTIHTQIDYNCCESCYLIYD